MAEYTRMRNNVMGYPIYGLPYCVVFPLLDEDGDPVTGLTCDSEVSKNGNTAVDCHNEGVEIAFDTATNKGMYYLDLTGSHTGTEMAADVVAVSVYSGAATTQATTMVLYPRKLPKILSGTIGATGNDTTHAHIPDGVAINDFYNGCILYMNEAGNDEARMITDYVASTKLATLNLALDAAPTASTSTYEVYMTEVAIASILAMLTGAIPNAVAGAASGLAIVGSSMVVPNTQKVDVETIKTQAVTCGAAVTIRADVGAASIVPTNTQFEARTLPAADYLVETDTLAAVTTVGSVTTKTGYSLAATGADLILKSSTFVQAIVAAVNEFATYGLTALNTLLVTTGIKTATTAAPTDMALNSTVAKDATVSKPGTAQTITAPADMALNSTVAKEATLTTKIPTALSFTGANVNAESKVTAAPTDMALNSTVAKETTAAAIKVITDALTAAAAAKLATSAGTIVSAAAAAGTLSTTQMTTNLTEVTDEHYKGRIIIWTSGVLINQATAITDYDGATKKLVFTAVTEAPTAADTFIIV